MQAHATKDGQETFRAVFICKKKERKGKVQEGKEKAGWTARQENAWQQETGLG